MVKRLSTYPHKARSLIWLAAFDIRSLGQSCSTLRITHSPLLSFLQSSRLVRRFPGQCATQSTRKAGPWAGERTTAPMPESDTPHTTPDLPPSHRPLLWSGPQVRSQQLRSWSCAGDKPHVATRLPAPPPGRFSGPEPGNRKVKSEERVRPRSSQETRPLRLSGALRAEPMWMHILKPHPLIPAEARGAAHIPLPNTPGSAPPSYSCVGRGLQRTGVRSPHSSLLNACLPSTWALLHVNFVRPQPSRSSPLSHLRVLTLHVAGQHLMCTSFAGRQALKGSWHDIDPPASSLRFYPSFLPPTFRISRVSLPSNAH